MHTAAVMNHNAFIDSSLSSAMSEKAKAPNKEIQNQTIFFILLLINNKFCSLEFLDFLGHRTLFYRVFFALTIIQL